MSCSGAVWGWVCIRRGCGQVAEWDRVEVGG